MTLCPGCGVPIGYGVLRCRHCGADAREANVTAMAGVETDSILRPDQIRALEALQALREAAPEVMEWMRTHPEERDRVLDLLLSLYRHG